MNKKNKSQNDIVNDSQSEFWKSNVTRNRAVNYGKTVKLPNVKMGLNQFVKDVNEEYGINPYDNIL